MKSNIRTKARVGMAMALAGVSMLCAACGANEPSVPDPSEQPVSEESGNKEQGGGEAVSSGQEQGSTSFREFSFAEVADREFYFSSGAGAWRTVLHIHEDGTFDGNYQDSDMGAAGPEFPNGTVYYSEFSGAFTAPEMVDDTTAVFQIDSIEYAHAFGEEVKDGYSYHYTAAYGLAGAENLYMYLPGAKLADLPEAYRNWVGYYNWESMQETELSFYGLYNEKEEEGFSSYAAADDAGGVKAEIAETEETAAELEDFLQNAALTQAELNVTAGQIYQAWDDTLNDIWGILKENLDAASMKRLTEEQLAWIAEKEAAAEAAGAEYEGGSMTAMAVNLKAAELTRERVYELAEYLQ